MVSRRYSQGCSGGLTSRLLIALVIAVVSVISYLGTQSKNPVTQQVQHIDMTPDQEIAMGLQAAPQMEDQFGGLDPNQSAQQRVQAVGTRIVNGSPAKNTPYQYQYHLLADQQVVNAFALPGGQIFITRALYDMLENEGELAGVLSHETGHVVARHSAEQLAKARLTEGLTGAAVMAACDPNNPNSCATSAQMAALVSQLVNMKFSRTDETQADELGVCFMSAAGYNPQDMIGVMKVLEQATQGQQQPPEFLSDHPSTPNRIQQIQQDIQNLNQCPK